MVKGSNMTKTNYGKKSMGMNRKKLRKHILKMRKVCVNVIFAWSKTTYASPLEKMTLHRYTQNVL